MSVETKALGAFIDALIENKARRVRTAEGARHFGVPVGTLIGSNGKPVVASSVSSAKPSAGRSRAGKAKHEVSTRKVSKVEVQHHDDGSKTVIQRFNGGRIVSEHANMASVDDHLDAILDNHEHVGSIRHEMRDQGFTVHHDGTVDHHRDGKTKKGAGKVGKGALSDQLCAFADSHDEHDDINRARNIAIQKQREKTRRQNMTPRQRNAEFSRRGGERNKAKYDERVAAAKEKAKKTGKHVAVQHHEGFDHVIVSPDGKVTNRRPAPRGAGARVHFNQMARDLDARAARRGKA